MIRQERESQKQNDKQQVKPGSKPDLGLVWQSAVFDFSRSREMIPCPNVRGPLRSEPPPRPRPRRG